MAGPAPIPDTPLDSPSSQPTEPTQHDWEGFIIIAKATRSKGDT